jgi:Carbohydrate esterase, sialic acid-specific acetylesterase
MSLELGLIVKYIARLMLATLLCGGFYAAGAYSQKNNVWPLPQLAHAKKQLADSPIQTDAVGRLLRYLSKAEIPCPAQDEKTAVLLVIGQSNAANHQGQRYRGLDSRVVNFAGSKCYLAESPLLGATGEYGEPWTLLANKLVAAELYHQVVLIPAGVRGTPIHRWAAGGDLNRMLIDVIDGAKTHYAITHVLWHQGETDFQLKTPEASYKADLGSLIGTVRALGVRAPFYVSRVSFQERYTGWTPANPVTLAQGALVDGKTILAGPDTDAAVTALDRFDGIHFSASGQEKFAAAWLSLLQAH